ncbi:MAG TPA: zf-HC2 domain-containing protein [Candidatus Saccharicenans sp.]|jgi:hypothetical protein|nr:zf-HC2 domain-containing protein [Candidatus Saccharicenans sp.]HRD02266.1 zf-HC2 domain-containing protein [Candidatus Saccharicenans sp.]
MECEKAQKLISDWLDGKLSRWKEKKLNKHLASCQLCQDYLEAQKIIQREALEIGKVENPSQWWLQFEQGIRKKLSLAGQPDEIQIAGEEKNNKKTKWWNLHPQAVRAISILTIVVGTLFLILYIGQRKNSEELPLSLMLSYEESYFNLSQILAQDEVAASDFATNLEETILEEIFLAGGEDTIWEVEYNYPLNNYQIESNDLRIENKYSEESL